MRAGLGEKKNCVRAKDGERIDERCLNTERTFYTFMGKNLKGNICTPISFVHIILTEVHRFRLSISTSSTAGHFGWLVFPPLPSSPSHPLATETSLPHPSTVVTGLLPTHVKTFSHHFLKLKRTLGHFSCKMSPSLCPFRYLVVCVFINLPHPPLSPSFGSL